MAQLRSDPSGSTVALGGFAVDDAPAVGANTPVSGNGAGHRSPTPWPLAASHLLLPLAAVAIGTLAGVGQAWLGFVAPVVVAALGLVVARTVTRRTAAAVGVAGWFGVASLVATVVMLIASSRQWSLLAGLATVAAIGVGDAALWVGLAGRSRAAHVAALRDAWRGAFAPPRAVAAWIVGAGVGLPLLSLYAPMITDADSAWIVVSTDRVRDQGLHLLQQNQDVFLPHLVVGPLLRLGGYPAANAFAAISVIALLALASTLGQWLTRRAVGAFGAALMLLAMPEIVQRTDRLPMYAVMLICGYGGGWLIHRAMSDPPAPRWWAALGGVGLVAAYEAHSVGQLFLLIPFLLLILHPIRRVWKAFGITLLTMLACSVPRVVVNYSIGGFERFRSNYTDWLIQKGYLRAVNQDFWGQRVNGSPFDYLANVPSMSAKAFGALTMAIVVVLAVVAARSARVRTSVFCVASVVIYLLALTIASPGTYARYLTPLSLGMALVAAVGLARLVEGRRAQRTFGMVVLVGLAVIALVSVTTDARGHQQLVHRVQPERRALTALIADGDGVLGVRNHDLMWADADLHTEFSRTMTEQDFMTYLTWPSDEQVLRLMDRLGVEYVVLSPKSYIEFDYHETWLRKFFGKQDHHDRVRTSSSFCRVATTGGYELYRVGACPGSS